MLLHRYVGGQVLAVLALAGPTVCAIAALLQLVRLLPAVAGAGIGAGEALHLGLLLCAVLAGAVLPASAVLAVAATMARLDADGELVALGASGASPCQIGAGPLAVCAAAALLSGLASLVVEPAAYGVLRERLGSLLVRSTIGGIQARVLDEPVPGLTVRVEGRQGNAFDGIFIEDRRGGEAVEVFAARGTMEALGPQPRVRLVLEDGVIHGEGQAGALRARFSQLESTLGLGAAATDLGEVAPARACLGAAELLDAARSGGPDSPRAALLLHRRLAAAPGALGLGALAILLGLARLGGRPWVLGLAACLVLGFHATSRLGEAAVQAGLLPPAAGGWLAPGLVWLFAASWVALRRARVLSSTGK